MTPTQMNCPHSGDGWCLDCVGELQGKLESLEGEVSKLRQQIEEAEVREVKLREESKLIILEIAQIVGGDLSQP